MTSKLKQFKADTYVFKQGEQGTSMFIILQGSVNVVIDATTQKSLVPIEVVGFVFHLRSWPTCEKESPLASLHSSNSPNHKPTTTSPSWRSSRAQ